MKTYINLSINERINYKSNLTAHWTFYGQRFMGLRPLYVMAYDYLIHPLRFSGVLTYRGTQTKPIISF